MSKYISKSAKIAGYVDRRFLYSVIGMALALILAWYVGNQVADENYFDIAIASTFIVGLISMVTLGRYWILLCFIPVAFRFSIAPTGFKIGPNELVLGILLFYSVIYCWRKNFITSAVLKSNFSLFTISVFAFLFYVILQTWLNIDYPFHEENVSWKNCAKSVSSIITGFVIIIFAAKNTAFSKLPRNIYSAIGLVLILALIFNISIRGYDTLILGEDATGVSAEDEFTAVPNTFYIPVINMVEDFWALRSLVPFAFIFGLMILYSKSAVCQLWSTKLIGRLLLILSIPGALLSGGRAVIIQIFILSALFLLVRKKILPLIIVIFLGITSLLCVKAAFTINPAYVPLGIQRSLAVIPFMDMDPDAMARIDSSSDWRYELFQRGMDDWKQSARTILTGRSNYAYTEADEQAMRLQGQEGQIEVNLRRGTTHNLITDLLVVYGLLGFLLYMVCMLTLIISLKRLRSEMYQVPEINDLTLLSLVLIIPAFFTAMIGGGNLELDTALAVGTTITLASQLISKKNAPLVTPSVSRPRANFMRAPIHQPVMPGKRVV